MDNLTLQFCFGQTGMVSSTGLFLPGQSIKRHYIEVSLNLTFLLLVHHYSQQLLQRGCLPPCLCHNVPLTCQYGSVGLVWGQALRHTKTELPATSIYIACTINRDIYLTKLGNKNYLLKNKIGKHHITFDFILTNFITQQEVYSTSTLELVGSIMKRKNEAIEARKTSIMLEMVDSPRMMVLAIDDNFSKIRWRTCDGSHVVYNEIDRDFLHN
ncbi:Kinesin-like protein KIN-8A, partial [Mucuna pruriens]